MKIKTLILMFLACAGVAHAQVPVTIAPVPRPQFFFANGAPLVNGCIFTYQAGGSTPYPTYTDSTGTSQNPNPIILDGGGFAPSGIWVAAQAYKFVVFSSGGSNCALGAQQWAIDYITPPPFLAGNNAWTGNQTFAGTSTFNGAVAVNAGGSLTGNFSGNPNFTGSPTFSGSINFPSGFIAGPSTFTSTVAFNGPTTFSSPATFNTTTSFTQAVTFSGTSTPTSSVGMISNLFSTASTNPALSGVFRLASGDDICWRNAANSADLCLSKDGSDIFQLPSSLNITGNLSVSGSLGFSGALTFPHWIAAGETSPTCTFTSGGGTGPSCAVSSTSTNGAGIITATTGAATPSDIGTITLIFSSALGTHTPICLGALFGAPWVSLGSAGYPAMITHDSSTTNAVFQWNTGDGVTALMTHTGYEIMYQCVGN